MRHLDQHIETESARTKVTMWVEERVMKRMGSSCSAGTVSIWEDEKSLEKGNDDCTTL